jgi:hypothetical protein
LRKIEVGRTARKCFIYTSDLLTSDNTTTATFTDDIAILAIHEEPAIASMKLQATVNKINDWAKKWRIKINQNKFTHIIFNLRNQTCPDSPNGQCCCTEKFEVKLPEHEC